MKNLKENNLFLILTPIVSTLIVVTSQFFIYDNYINYNALLFFLLNIPLCLAIICFAFWCTIIYRDNKNIKDYFIHTAIISVSLIALNFAILLILNNWISTSSQVAILTNIITIDVCILFLVGISIGKLIGFSAKKVICLILSFVLIIDISFVGVFIGFKLITDTPSNDLEVIQSFEVYGDIPNGNGAEAKVILLGGQSNATGCSSTKCLKDNISSIEYNKYATGFNNVQINYFSENGNNKSVGFVDVSLGQGYSLYHFGPELGMGELLSSTYTTETIFIIKYTWSGSNLYSQWKAPTNNGQAGPMYTAFVNYVKTNMIYLLNHNYNATIDAMCWMQGESDSDDTNAPLYGQRTQNLVNSLRSDLSQYINTSGMLFVDAGISNSPYWKNYQTINQQKSSLVNVLTKYEYIDTIAENLSYDKEPTIQSPDLAHYDSTSQIKLGHLFAQKIINYYNN